MRNLGPEKWALHLVNESLHGEDWAKGNRGRRRRQDWKMFREYNKRKYLDSAIRNGKCTKRAGYLPPHLPSQLLEAGESRRCRVWILFPPFHFGI